MYPVLYKAHVVNPLDNYKINIVYGVTLADSFKDAMEKIESYYGDEIVQISLFMEDESSVYEFENDYIPSDF